MIIGAGIGPGSALEAYLHVQDSLKRARRESSSEGEEPAEARRRGMTVLLMVGAFGAGLLAGMFLQ
jgi:hypothetical protein